MKLFEIPMVVTSLLGLCFLPDPQVPAARADFTFGPRVNLGPNVNSPQTDGNPVISPNGLELYFVSNRPGGYGRYNTWVSKRASVEDPWGPPENLGPRINGAGSTYPKSISSDGLTLYLTAGFLQFYTTTRPAIDAPWGPLVDLGPVVNIAEAYRAFPVISPDDLELYLGICRADGLGRWGIYVSTRATPNDPWGPPVNLGPMINTVDGGVPMSMSPDGRILFINADRPGGFGSSDTWMTWRPSKGAAWSAPVNLGPSFNTPGDDALSSVSPDGRWAYIYEQGPAGPYGDLWMAPIFPLVDINGDDRINDKDVLVLQGRWGQADGLCDIGPFPWGDGVVDTHDLRILQETITGSDPTAPLPHAADVPRDTILSWVSAPFAQSYDVYFGTSPANVDSADRANPRGVLVSQGITATTYDPEGLLDYSRTYYWRVDLVSAGPAPLICKGAVLEFTTEAFAYPIKNVTAKASSAQADCGPEKTVDGSGLDKTDGHSTDQKDMWWSLGVSPNWIQYEFDRVYHLHELWIWNFNLTIEPVMGFGAETVKIEYSTDGTKWAQLANVPEFARASGKPGCMLDTTVSFGGVSAKYVKLTIEKRWGTTPVVGLSEVRFFYIPDRPTAQP